MSSRNLMQRSLFSRPSRTCSGRSILMSCIETLATRFARRCSSCSSGERRLAAQSSAYRRRGPPAVGSGVGGPAFSAGTRARPAAGTARGGGGAEGARSGLVHRAARVGIVWHADIDGFSREIARFVILECRCLRVNHLRIRLCPEVPQLARGPNRCSVILPDCSPLAGDQLIVCEDYVSANQLGRIDCFKSFNSVRLTMTSLRGRVLKNEKVQETRGVVLLLPSEIHVRTRLICLNVTNKVSDGLLDLVYRGRVHLIRTSLIDGH